MFLPPHSEMWNTKSDSSPATAVAGDWKSEGPAASTAVIRAPTVLVMNRIISPTVKPSPTSDRAVQHCSVTNISSYWSCFLLPTKPDSWNTSSLSYSQTSFCWRLSIIFYFLENIYLKCIGISQQRMFRSEKKYWSCVTSSSLEGPDAAVVFSSRITSGSVLK